MFAEVCDSYFGMVCVLGWIFIVWIFTLVGLFIVWARHHLLLWSLYQWFSDCQMELNSESQFIWTRTEFVDMINHITLCMFGNMLSRRYIVSFLDFHCSFDMLIVSDFLVPCFCRRHIQFSMCLASFQKLPNNPHHSTPSTIWEY